jgi:hypothetical protein
MDKVYILKAGKTLYHGSSGKFEFPNRPGGTWFATDPRQSIYYAMRGFMYVYKTKRDLRLLRFDSSKDMNNWAYRSDFSLPANETTFAFTTLNKNLSMKLCRDGLYDGWWFPNDQTQVMLCKPESCLLAPKIYKIEAPYGIPSIENVLNQNKFMYRVRNSNARYKFKLTKTTHNLNANSIYEGVGRGPLVYFTSNRKPINLTYAQLVSKGYKGKAVVRHENMNNYNTRHFKYGLPNRYADMHFTRVVLYNKNAVNAYRLNPTGYPPWERRFLPLPPLHPKHMNINISPLFRNSISNEMSRLRIRTPSVLGKRKLENN